MENLEEGLKTVVASVGKELKKNKDLAPLLGAIIGVYLARDEETLDKLVSGVLGGGLGAVVKGLLEDSNGKK